VSIVPTREFLSWRGALKAGQVPSVDATRLRRVRMVIHGELAAVVVILLCAAIMARRLGVAAAHDPARRFHKANMVDAPPLCVRGIRTLFEESGVL
jgi:hypothetical protein